MPKRKMHGNPALAKVADGIVARDYANMRSALWEEIRDICDLATGGEYDPFKLDLLTDMVAARVSKRRSEEVTSH